MPRPSIDELVSKIKSGLTRAEVMRAGNIREGGSWHEHWKEAVKLSGGLPATEGHTIAGMDLVRLNEYMKPIARRQLQVTNGTVIVGSDAHYWPGIISTAHRGMVRLIGDLRPGIVVMNGDVFDGAQASRHARIGWQSTPKVFDEIKACQDRLGEIESAAGHKQLYWPLGNHDARFETKLAAMVPEFERVEGMQLRHHFPSWLPCWSVWVNDNTVIKHRSKSGIHAPHNNTMWAGRSIITGHLHSAKVMPISDYNGTRYGVDCGTLAQPYGEQFTDYTEDNPVNWRSAFCILTYWKGMLLWPELCHVIDEDKGLCQFRGTVFEV